MAAQISHDIVVDTPAERIFELLADPREHARFDGSGSVRGRLSGPERLSAGARFGMRMRIGVPYTISNEVVEFEEGRRIAWRHFGHHVWRYQLEPLGEGRTRVTETFDWSRARAGVLYPLMGIPGRNSAAIEATLRRLKDLAEDGVAPRR